MELDREAAAALGISADVVARAASRRREGRTLAEALAEIGATGAATFGRALAEAAGLPFAAAPPALPARELTALLPMPFAKRHLVLPLARDGAGLAVALADPAALAALEDLRFLYRAPVRPLVVPAPALREAITRAYDAAARSAADTMDAIEDERLDLVASELDEPPDLLEAGDDTPVLRLLDRASALLDLRELGLAPATAAALERVLGQSHGLVLVTGPTGSGKTTTLYAALRRLATGERNIMTIEDPIEYQLRGIGQMQVNPRIDLTFAAGLRAVLRQDPDVILVGEIRDRETVEIAMQAALTGHLVFSTLHTTDACGAITRLLDMAVEPFLISSSLLAVLAQRLVRRVCAG